MILAGGRVDELGVLTHYRPKSAVPFGGFARVIDFPLSNLLHSGIERIAILSQYRSYSLINHIGTGAAWDMIGRNRGISILPPFKDYENPHWYRGSADAVYQNIDYMQYYGPSVILILSGDHIYQMDYRKMIRYHKEHDADLTAAFIQVPLESASRFGVAEIADDFEDGGRMLSYEEKPAEPKGRWASLTVFCFRPSVLFEALKKNQENTSYEFGRDIIQRGPAPLGLRRFFFVGENSAAVFKVVGDLGHPETRSRFQRHLDERRSQVGVVFFVVADHFAVIHLVDVIAGENEDHRRPVILHVIDVLIDRVGAAPIPVRIFVVFKRRQNGNAAIAPDHVPGGAGADVVDQRIGAVLAEDGDALDAGVEQVGQGKIDDPGKTAKGNG
jgi:NDP-sugar pyrophosphorylase family protein